MNEDTLVRDVFIPSSSSKIFTIFTVEIFAVLNEITRFLAYGESFTIAKFIKKSILLLPLVNDATDTY